MAAPLAGRDALGANAAAQAPCSRHRRRFFGHDHQSLFALPIGRPALPGQLVGPRKCARNEPRQTVRARGGADFGRRFVERSRVALDLHRALAATLELVCRDNCCGRRRKMRADSTRSGRFGSADCALRFLGPQQVACWPAEVGRAAELGVQAANKSRWKRIPFENSWQNSSPRAQAHLARVQIKTPVELPTRAWRLNLSLSPTRWPTSSL